MKVLIVDDSSFITLFCRQALLKEGYEVVGEAYDGEEAVEKAFQLKPHLVLMDIA
ncbi:MAG: response regulator [Bdellovibrionales bacterium]|nr:response regulator [Bdellovibrionales bacterium]